MNKHAIDVYSQNTTGKHPNFAPKQFYLSKKTIFLTSLLHFEVTMMITFYTLFYNKTSTIFHINFKVLYNFFFRGGGGEKCIIPNIVLFSLRGIQGFMDAMESRANTLNNNVKSMKLDF